MRLGPSVFLGLAVGDRGVACAEVSVAGGRRAVRRSATFHFAQGAGLDAPAAAGQALALFLRENRFSASRAVVGVPARWLIASEREVPPSDPEQARAVLRLHAERQAVGEGGELVFDYAGEPDPAQPTAVLLIGMLRQQLEKVEQLMDAAGVKVLAVTASSLVLAAAAGSAGPADSAPVVVLAGQGVEMVLRRGGAPRMLRHVGALVANGHGPASVAPIAADLRRAAAMSGGTVAPVAPLAPAGRSGNGKTVPGPAPGREALLWDGVGLSAQQVDELATRSGLALRPARGLEWLAVEPAADAPGGRGEPSALAVALALAAADRALVPLDFQKSRLTPRKVRRLSNRSAWALIGGGAVLAAVIALFVTVHQREGEAAALQAQLDVMKPDIKKAESTVDRVTYGRGYFATRPPMLECLRELTLAFQPEDPVWLTSFNLRDNRKGSIIGRATNERAFGVVLDRLKKNRKFADVKLIEWHEAGGRSKDVVFSASFTFIAPY